MNNHPFEEAVFKRKINSLEKVLQTKASKTAEVSFPSWEEVSRRNIVYVDFHEKQKKQKENLQWFFASFGIASSVLAASLFFSVWIARPVVEEQNIAKVEMKPIDLPPPEVPTPRVLKVLQVKGQVKLVREGIFLRVTKDTEWLVGDRFEVGKKSEVELEMEDLIYFKLLENSQAELVANEKTSKKSVSEIRLETGVVLAHLIKLQKDETFRIKSGIWDTEVRGTTFSVSYSEKKGQRVSVAEGSVAVRNREEVGLEEVIMEKQAATFQPEKPPEIAPISKAEEKTLAKLQSSVQSNKERGLFEEFKRWELVRLEDGTEIKGVILGQTETDLRVKTIEGEILVPIAKVLETEKIR